MNIKDIHFQFLCYNKYHVIISILKGISSMSSKRKTWRDKPTIINKIPDSLDKMIMYVDESGEGNQKVLKKSYDDKNKKIPYNQRNDLYILNGVVLSGFDSKILKNKMDKIKNKICKDGMFDYEGKGLRPIVFRNHNLSAHTPPFDNMSEKNFEDINKMIKMTNYVQISAGLNYYSYTQNNIENPDKNASPLLMSLGLLLVNYADYLNSINKKGIIIFEEETKTHDAMKLKYILKVLKNGNKTYNKNFFSKITAVYFRKKWTEEKEGIYVTTSGLELADLTISPLRRVLHPEFLLIERKLYNYPNYIKKGFTIIT